MRNVRLSHLARLFLQAYRRDDLSLLANLSEKEWKKQHDKGIFTVTQLSLTFRPRRRITSLPDHHQHALKAAEPASQLHGQSAEFGE